MADPAIHEYLSDALTERMGQPSDVFWAVREVRGKPKAGFWYRVWENERREKWVHFGFLAGNIDTGLWELDELAERLKSEQRGGTEQGGLGIAAWDEPGRGD